MKTPLLLTLLCVSALAFAQQPPQQQRPQPPREQGAGGSGAGGGGPPPEALEACKGKKDGDGVHINTPRGDTLPATCRMVALPARRPADNKGPSPQRQQ